MRGIKFKGKAEMSQKEMDDINIPHQNGWVFGNLIIDRNEVYIVAEVIECASEYIVLGWWVKVHAESVGQYTSFKDMNGKEIYEGNIAVCAEYGCIGKIVWDEDISAFLYAILESDGDFYNEWIFDYADEMEVIGNIYDNPELLEVQ